MSSERRQIPEPDYEDPKEVYAFFGLAAYAAQCLEKELMNLCALVTLGRASKRDAATTDATFDEMEAKTLGQLLKTARELVKITALAEDLLSRALKTRNRLIHRFFADHAERFLSANGRRVMIDELVAATRLFHEADHAASQVTLRIQRAIGLTDEMLRREFDALKQRAEAIDRDDPKL